MAEFPAPIKHNGFFSNVFNSQDYLISNTTAVLLQLESNINSTPNSIVATFTNPQTYDYSKGNMYTLASDSTVISILSFTNLPTIPHTSYVFTFILTPSIASTPYYILPNTNFVLINGISTPLSDLSNVSLPSSYTTLIQQVTIMNTSDTNVPNFNAINSVVGTILKYPVIPTILMAVGGGSKTETSNVIYSTDNGLTWAINKNACSTSLNKNNWNAGNSVIYNPTNNMWTIATGINYMYSTDYGVTWTLDTSQPYNIYTIVWNGTMYLNIGYDGSEFIHYSYDGKNWTAGTNTKTVLSNNAYTGLYNNGQWLCVGNGGGKGNIIYSKDGITWAYNTNGGDKLINQGFCIAYNGSMYLVGGQKGSQSMIYSTDSINWFATNNATTIATSHVYGIGWNGNNQWVAIGRTTSNTGVIMYSSDGNYWTLSTSGSAFIDNIYSSTDPNANINLNSYSLGSVLWYNNAWIVGGYSTTSSIIHSTDGINWTASNNNIFDTLSFGCNAISSGLGNLPLTA